MKNKRRFRILVGLLIIFSAGIIPQKIHASNFSLTDTIRVFTLPEIPSMLTAPEARADYLVNNYWKNVNFADPNYAKHSDLIEQAWVDYCDILG